MNDTQRKLLRTALKQTNHAKSNIRDAVYLEGLEFPEVDKAWQELDTAWRRLWNTLHDSNVFRIPEAERTRTDIRFPV